VFNGRMQMKEGLHDASGLHPSWNRALFRALPRKTIENNNANISSCLITAPGYIGR